jgi:hypothetical protein
MAAQTTPGPWRIDDDYIFGPKGEHIVMELGPNDADARLIAAAPAMRELLAQRIALLEASTVEGRVLSPVSERWLTDARALLATIDGGNNG